MERAVTQVQTEGVLGEESHPSTSTVGAARQVKFYAWAIWRGSEEEVSGKAPSIARLSIGSLWSLQGNPKDILMRLLDRKGATIRMQKDKQRTSAKEVVIPKASKGAQLLKVTGKGNGRTRGCRNMQMQ